MRTRAAVLRQPWALPRPYAESKPLAIEELELDPPGPRRGAGADQGRGPVPLRPLGDQRRPAAADADGARPRGGRRSSRSWAQGVADLAVGDHVVLRLRAELRPLHALRRGPAGAVRAGRGGQRRRHAALRRAAAAPGRRHADPPPPRRARRFAEYAVVSRRSLVKIDPELPLDEAALFGCAVLTGVGAVVNTAQVPAGASVAVIGLGGVGLCSLLGAVAAGAREVVAIDLSDEKLRLRARSSARRATFNAARPGLRRAGREPRPAAASSTRSSSPARSGRSSSPTGSPAAAAPPSPPGLPPPTRHLRAAGGQPRRRGAHAQGQLHRHLRADARHPALHRSSTGAGACRSTA